MNERLITCPECNSTEVEVVQIHDPHTTNINCRATLRCENGHTWEGLVANESED